jgi:predicted phosphodiesterase
VFSGRVKPLVLPGRKKSKTKITRALVLTLSDLHWGADLVKSETGSQTYGTVEEARGLAEVVKQTCEYKIEHREETELHVLLLGDFIHGCLHDVRDGAVISEQQSRAIHLLIQAIAHFSEAFPSVHIHCVTGNHGRDKSRHEKRATAGKYDSRETLIYSAVKSATRACKNVKWDIPRSAFCVFELFGKKYFITHGDTVFNAGNPGKSIDIASLEKQVNRLNATLSDKDEYVVVIVGHAHTSLMVLLNNGVTVIINGPGTPVDPYAVSIGIFETVCSQQLFEAVMGHPVGDSRRITIDSSVWNNKALDDLIQPWTDY